MKACKLSPHENAGVAQLAEQLIRNQQVGSSNLLPGSINQGVMPRKAAGCILEQF